MNHRVLIVDDSLTVRMDLHDAFEEAGFAPVLAASAAEAWRALQGDPPRIIVLDVVLPDADGVQLLGELQARLGPDAVPVILLSSEAEVKDRIRGLQRGAHAYIGKPYDASYVVARASELLRREHAAPREACTILVIDDSRTYREEMAACLAEAGYRTVVAGSAVEGLRKAADLQPDAIVVDGVMPEMDGTAVVRRLRLDPGLSATPCILLTASEGSASEVLALDAGADAYVRKSEELDVILARVGAILRSAEESRDRGHAPSLMGPKRILAVDDSSTYLEEIAEQLRADGYEVVRAHSGEDALELLAVEEVDCILLDLVMPGLSGTETCRRIKSSPATRNLPLVMLTAREDPGALIDSMNAGADDYVAKSVDFEVIRARLRAQLRRKQFEDENRRVRENILRKDVEVQIARAQAEARAAMLEALEVKNRELQLLNREMQMFAHSVSHDLRQPLRGMDGFSKAMLEQYGERLDERGRHYLQRIRAGAQRMGDLIDGLLLLSRVTRKPIQPAPIRLGDLARRVLDRLRDAEPQRVVDVQVADDMEAWGDPQLVESVLENLLGNAWKFTAHRQPAHIEVGWAEREGARAFFVRDDGAGFNMEYAGKLFTPFQRLHSDREFAGTGIGLATVQRIVHRHGGRIWAEGAVERGATFFFTLAAQAEHAS